VDRAKRAGEYQDREAEAAVRGRDEQNAETNSENVYIVGDNLDALQHLKYSYAEKIKCIYIDPPYNTGKDFVYKDDFRDNVANYKRITGQVDDEGRSTGTHLHYEVLVKNQPVNPLLYFNDMNEEEYEEMLAHAESQDLD